MFAFRPLGGLREERSTHLAQYLNTDVQFVKLLISREVRYIYAVSLNSVRTCEVTQFLIFYICYSGTLDDEINVLSLPFLEIDCQLHCFFYIYLNSIILDVFLGNQSLEHGRVGLVVE